MSMKEHEILMCPVKWIKTGEDALGNPTRYELRTVGDSCGKGDNVICYRNAHVIIRKKNKTTWATHVTALTSETAGQTKKDVEDELGIVSIPSDEYDKLTEKGN